MYQINFCVGITKQSLKNMESTELEAMLWKKFSKAENNPLHNTIFNTTTISPFSIINETTTS